MEEVALVSAVGSMSRPRLEGIIGDVPVRTTSSRKEKTAEFVARRIRSCVSSISRYDAPRLR